MYPHPSRNEKIAWDICCEMHWSKLEVHFTEISTTAKSRLADISQHIPIAKAKM